MTPPAALQQDRIDEADSALSWIRDHLDEEDRSHLALELMDATRSGDAYHEVLNAWARSLMAREHDMFQPQVKEYFNLVDSGEIVQGIES